MPRPPRVRHEERACLHPRPLEDALDRGAHVRILTADYLAITDPDALTQLADLAEDPDRRLEVRLFSGGSIAFHPKAYIFCIATLTHSCSYGGRHRSLALAR